MFNHFEGKITMKTPTYTVVDCGGVGYLMNISLHTYSRIPDSGNFRLFAHLAVREDAMVLYGFADEEEREIFRQLISVSGVGPGTARMILSSMSPSEIVQAIHAGNVSALRSVKGIGEKSAQRIIIDLKGKMGKGTEGISAVSFGGDNKMRDEALTALVTLGFARNVAEKAIDKALASEGKAVSVEHLLKIALKNL
ncbi:MAG TPA: Holliday junction branch migration protein RuvA [Bacteroidia bacterium]|nr:Holliday junction branch migration protein RuvA [Bacteroidia bacterium]